MIPVDTVLAQQTSFLGFDSQNDWGVHITNREATMTSGQALACASLVEQGLRSGSRPDPNVSHSETSEESIVNNAAILYAK